MAKHDPLDGYGAYLIAMADKLQLQVAQLRAALAQARRSTARVQSLEPDLEGAGLREYAVGTWTPRS